MQRTLLLVLACFCIIVPSALSIAEGASAGKDQVLMVKGSNAMASLVDEWGKAFAAANPGVTVLVTGGGTDAGLDALFDKNADMAMASRKILDKERQVAVLSDCKPAEFEVCTSVIAIITHPANPIHDLTVEQAKKIFTGETTGWGELGGPAEPITLFITQPTSGTAEFIRERILDHDYFSTAARTRDYYLHIIKELARKTPPGLAYAPLQEAQKAQESKLVRIMGIKKDPNSSPVLPSIAAARDGSYPLAMPIYFYWNEQKTNPLVKKFADFCKEKCRTQR
jgi:phosphate transport system substrate-binding protein